MTAWAKLLLMLLQGLGSLASAFNRKKHNEIKDQYHDDPVGSFNDKFNGVSNVDTNTNPVCDKEACSQCSGKCLRKGGDK